MAKHQVESQGSKGAAETSRPRVLIIEANVRKRRDLVRALAPDFVALDCDSLSTLGERVAESFEAYLVNIQIPWCDGPSVVRDIRVRNPFASMAVAIEGVSPRFAHELGVLNIALVDARASDTDLLRAFREQVHFAAKLSRQSGALRFHRELHERMWLDRALPVAISVRRLARLLQMDRSHLQRRLARYDVRRDGVESPELER